MKGSAPHSGVTIQLGLIAACVLLCTSPARAQEFSVAHVDTVRVAADSTLQVRPFVLAETVQVRISGRLIAFSVDAVRGLVRPEGARPGDIAVVSYRALPIDLQTEYRLLREPIQVADRPGRPATNQSAREPTSSVRSRGTISRGVIAGSNRDVAVESGLRLNLEGELAPGVGVRAALTDADSPIRPDGTTQRLSEFDRVFVELTARPGRVTLGDFQGQFTGSRMAGLDRKLQGVMLRSSSSERVQVAALGATSRGEFRSQQLEPIDGVQGPYRLEGPSGDQFILILPGSERVYVDGQLMVRGEAGDYTIDYTVGELTFTASRLITADRRITVEFEYDTNQFTRTLLGVEVGANVLPRWSVGASIIREADSGEFLDEFGLTAADSLLLTVSGDRGALISGARQVVYDPEARFVQYRQEVIQGDTVFAILEGRPEEGEAVFRVQFSRVGASNGRYQRAATGVNGIGYVYAGPGEGAYEPVRRLPAPALQALLDLRTTLRPISGLELRGEFARSVTDLNRLSVLDAQDDGGRALWLEAVSDTVRIGAHTRLHTRGSFRDLGANFRVFERFRDVEFAREWGLAPGQLDPLGSESGEREWQLGAGLWLGDSLRTDVEAAGLELPGRYEGLRYRAQASYGGFVQARRLDVRSDDLLAGASGRFVQDFVRVTPHRGRVTWFTEVEHETSTQRESGDLRPISSAFVELRPGLSVQRNAQTWSAFVERRFEQAPLEGRLQGAADAWTAGVQGEFSGGSGLTGDLDLAWSSKTVREAFTDRLRNTRALLLALSGRAAPGGINLSWRYDARTERTPVLEEVYLRTGPELGAFVWEDLNGDGAVQVDELLPETTPNEGTYIRTFLPSDSLASVNSVALRVLARSEPWVSGTRVRLQSLFDVQEQSRTDSRLDVYLLRLGTFRVPGLTTRGRVRVRQDVALSRPDFPVSVDLAVQENRSLSELSGGLERRESSLAEATVQIRLGDQLQASLRGALENDETDSERFASRRYALRTRRIEPSLTLRRGRLVLRSGLEAAWKQDRLSDGDARIARIPVSGRWSVPAKGDFSGRVEVSSVRLAGTGAAGLAGFELTDGRGDGTSIMWGVGMQRALTGSLRATLAYDGRAPSGRPVVHTGRFQLSAVF
ncbi:MAG: hypothetical protein JJ896_17920 [Rhodothermales bacterium]|nr:hypothetical protein [Rhodothermales bacterium]MBO6781541.1 hypothetical protein [Rhodothermales bacterium]